MSNVRTCLYFLVLLVNYRLAASQPTFGSQIWCSMFCSEDDDSSDDSDDYSFFDLFDISQLACYGCYSEPSSPEPVVPEKPVQQPVKLMIPPSTGLNLTVFSNIGGVLMDLVPWMSSATSTATAGQPITAVTPAAAPANATAGNATTPAA